MTAPAMLSSPDLNETVSFQENDEIKAKAGLSAAKAVEVVEFYLTLKTDIFSDSASMRPGQNRDTITAPEKNRLTALPHSVGRTVPMSTSREMKPNTLDQYQLKTDSAEMAEKPLENSFTATADGAFSKLKHIINSLNGNVLSAEYDRNTDQPRSLEAEIPAGQYRLFFEKLQELGTLQTSTPPIDATRLERIKIRIQLVYS